MKKKRQQQLIENSFAYKVFNKRYRDLTEKELRYYNKVCQYMNRQRKKEKGLVENDGRTTTE